MACISKRRGRWVLDFYDQHGERQRITMPEGSTKKETEEELDTYKDSVRKGTYVSDKKVPLFSKVAREWIDYKKPNLRETTWEVYEGHVRNHFGDLDRLKTNQITVATVEKFITALQVEGMNIGTLRKILVVLGQIMSFAVRRGYHYYNPFRDAERPRGQARLTDEEEAWQDMKILNPAQITAFLNQIDDPKYKTLFMLAVFSGARQGELLGLRWGDIDWERCQLAVQRTFNNGRVFPPRPALPRER